MKFHTKQYCNTRVHVHYYSGPLLEMDAIRVSFKPTFQVYSVQGQLILINTCACTLQLFVTASLSYTSFAIHVYCKIDTLTELCFGIIGMFAKV